MAIVKRYVHVDSESNFDLAKELGMPEGSEAAKLVEFLGYEEELAYHVDTATGECKVIAVNGFKVSEEKL